MDTIDRDERLTNVVEALLQVVSTELNELMRLGDNQNEMLASIMTAASVFSGHAIGTSALILAQDDGGREKLINEYAERLAEIAACQARGKCGPENVNDVAEMAQLSQAVFTAKH